jgi:hypothetical protein
MANLAITYQHIADILSFKTANSELEKVFSNPLFDWDGIVITGSKHLVLPAIYCRLKSRQLTHLLPDELNTYLKEITLLNSTRNKSILEQIHHISELFKTHNIDHVFLKGSALIAAGFYNDFAERMLGDIDILVAEHQLDLAFSILKKDSYYPIKQTLGHDFFEHKHLPRLKTDKYICAVELHRKLFVNYKDKALTNSNILLLKQENNGIYIPALQHLTKHNILNYQVNDKGRLYNSISFRSAYDCITLMRYYNHHSELKQNKIIKRYYNTLNLFFNDISFNKQKKINLYTSFYLFKLKHLKFYKSWNRFLKVSDFLYTLVGRIPHFLTNKAYRKALINDKKRVFSYFKHVLKNS